MFPYYAQIVMAGAISSPKTRVGEVKVARASKRMEPTKGNFTQSLLKKTRRHEEPRKDDSRDY